MVERNLQSKEEKKIRTDTHRHLHTQAPISDVRSGFERIIKKENIQELRTINYSNKIKCFVFDVDVRL